MPQFARLAFVVISAAAAIILVSIPYKHWGLPYLAGFFAGVALMNVHIRLKHGYWP